MKAQFLVFLAFSALSLLTVDVTNAVKTVTVFDAIGLLDVFASLDQDVMKTNVVLGQDIDFGATNTFQPFGLEKETSRCIPYSGEFNGNGHAIKGLKINNTEKTKYPNAGLFCSLKGAKIENLIIDESCSFEGTQAGSLCASVKGSTVIRNVINKANVTGVSPAGGLFAFVQVDDFYQEIIVDNCKNHGRIVGAQMCAGGIIGKVGIMHNSSVKITNCTNFGAVHGNVGRVGGIVSMVEGAMNSTLIILECKNEGTITGDGFAGGIVGIFYNNEGHQTWIEKSSNNGMINSEKEYAGGIVGLVDNNTIVLSIRFCVNTGDVKGLTYASGFVGCITTNSEEKSTFFQSLSVANYGKVHASQNDVCGIYCILEKQGQVYSEVYNTINKGDISGKNGFGIANIVSKARGVISMGQLSSATNQPFWSSEVGEFKYGLKRICNGCKESETFEKVGEFYLKTDNRRWMDEEMSEVSITGQYGMLWNKDLDMFYALFLGMGPPVNHTMFARPGEKLQTAFDILNFSFDPPLESFTIVNRSSWEILVNESTIESETNIAFCFNLTVNGVENITELFVEYQTPISQTKELSHFFNERYEVIDSNDNTIIYENTIMNDHMSITVIRKMAVILGNPIEREIYVMKGTKLHDVAKEFGIIDNFIMVDRSSWNVLNSSMLINDDVDIALCHELVTSGELNETMNVEHGTLFSNIPELSQFLNNSYAIFDSNNNTIYNESTALTSNTSVKIKKVNVLETEFEFDGKSEDVDLDRVKKDIEDLMKDNGNIIKDIIVKETENNRLVVLVTVVDDDTHDAADALLSCSKYHS